jgi:hypothetical protein
MTTAQAFIHTKAKRSSESGYTAIQGREREKKKGNRIKYTSVTERNQVTVCQLKINM